MRNIIITQPRKATSIKLQTWLYMVNEHILSLFFHSGKQIKELGRENDERDFPEDYQSPTLTFLITFSPAIALAALNITNTLEYKLLCFKPYLKLWLSLFALSLTMNFYKPVKCYWLPTHQDQHPHNKTVEIYVNEFLVSHPLKISSVHNVEKSIGVWHFYDVGVFAKMNYF